VQTGAATARDRDRPRRSRRAGGARGGAVPILVSLSLHGAFVAASVLVSAGPGLLESTPAGPITISLMMPRARSAFVPPREQDLSVAPPVIEEVELFEMEPVTLADDLLAVRPSEEELAPPAVEDIMRQFADAEHVTPERDPRPEPDSAAVVGAVPLSSANRPPCYPGAARRRGWQGRVLLDVEVLRDGTVGAIAVSCSSGHRLLDEAALSAVRRWRFTPAMRSGLAVATHVRVRIVFSLGTPSQASSRPSPSAS